MEDKTIPEKEAFDAWLAHPVTQAHRRLLRRWQEGLKDQWAAGMFQDEGDSVVSTVRNTNALEVSRVLGQLINMDYEEFERGLSDE